MIKIKYFILTIRAIISNNIAQLARLSLINHVITFAINALNDKIEAMTYEITKELEYLVLAKITSIGNSDLVIHKESILQAVELLEYFNKHMLLISNYPING